MNIGYAPTETIPRVPATTRATAPAPVSRATIRPGTLVTYRGTFPGAAGHWVFDGPCACRCGKLQLWRHEGNGLRRIGHVSPGSVAEAFR